MNELEKIYNEVPSFPAQPMKWYKFMIYVSLFFSAAYCAYNGFKMFFFGQYGEYLAQVVYNTYPGLKILDVIMGIYLLSLAVGCLITRQKLSNFCKNAPTLLYVLLAVDLCVSFVYLILCSMILGVNVFEQADTSFYIVIIRNILVIVFNRMYFKKREHLFVH